MRGRRHADQAAAPEERRCRGWQRRATDEDVIVRPDALHGAVTQHGPM